MKADLKRPEIVLTPADAKALLAFANPPPASKPDLPSPQILFERVPFSEGSKRELCRAIAVDSWATVLLVLEGPGSPCMFESLKLSSRDLKKHYLTAEGNLFIAKAECGGADIFDEEGQLNDAPLPAPAKDFPPWKEVIPARRMRHDVLPARAVSLDMARCGSLLSLVQASVGCGGILLRSHQSLGQGTSGVIDIVRFDTEPGKNGMRALGALCGRRLDF